MVLKNRQPSEKVEDICNSRMSGGKMMGGMGGLAVAVIQNRKH